MGYAATTGAIFYCKPDQPFVMHRYDNDWFDEYNYRISMEDRKTPGYLLLQQDPEIYIHN